MAVIIAPPKIRILLVCSNEEHKTLAKTVFNNQEDCEVSTVSNPRLAYYLFSNYFRLGRPFRVVFIDYLLQCTNGITLAKNLQALYPQVQLEFYASHFFGNPGIRQDYIELFGYDKATVDSCGQVEEILAVLRAGDMNDSSFLVSLP